MSHKLVRVDQIRVQGRDDFNDLNRVRTHVRKALYGRTEPVGAVVEVVWPNGDVEDWTFGPHVGYPEGSQRDWMRDWIEQHT